MRQSRIYCHKDLEKALLSAAPFSLDDRSTHYLLNVLRIKNDDGLILFDGRGKDYLARVVELNKRSLSVIVESTSDRRHCESPLHTTLALGISKGERMDYAVQKAVELGVNCLQPVITERVVVNKKPERLQKKIEHLNGVVISACEQSGRSVVPNVNPIMQLHDWLANLSEIQNGINLTFKVGGQPLIAKLNGLPDVEAVRLLVGPEGGLSETEIALAEQYGFQGVGMGPRVLRTETAPLVALTLLQSALGDLR